MKQVRRKRYTGWILTGLIVIGFGCNNSDELSDHRGYELEWEDNFDGEAGTLPDSDTWTYDLGGGGWGNQELQVYTNNPENVSLDGEGNLVITAIRNGNQFTSARVKTQGLLQLGPGRRFEARLKTPYGPGVWPAFWLLGANIDEVEWPNCGEIDVMELRGQEPSKIAGSIHGPGYSGGNAITTDFELVNDRFDSDYHTFAIDWGEGFIDFFVDDQLYQTINPDDVPGEWVFDHSFFMIFNIAVGGSYVGFPSPDTPFPQQMIIDYVRTYRLIAKD